MEGQRARRNVIPDFDRAVDQKFFYDKTIFYFDDPHRSSMPVKNIGALVTNDFANVFNISARGAKCRR